MNDVIAFLIQIVLSLVLSMSVVIHINQALYNILQELCPTEKHAKFWQVYLRAFLCILPLLIVLFTDILTELTGLDHIKMALTTTLVGLLISLIVIGLKIYPSRLENTNLGNMTE